jgi:hypothetical protein
MASRLAETLARASRVLSEAADTDWPVIVAENGEMAESLPAGSVHILPTVREATADELRMYRKSLVATTAFAESAAMTAVRALPAPATFDQALLYLATALALPSLPALGAPEANYAAGAAVPTAAEVEDAIVTAVRATEEFGFDDDEDEDEAGLGGDESDDGDDSDDGGYAAVRTGSSSRQKRRVAGPLFRLSKRGRHAWCARALEMVRSRRALQGAASVLEGELAVLSRFARDGGALLAGNTAAAADANVNADAADADAPLAERALGYFTVVRDLGHEGLQEMQRTVQARFPDLHAAVQTARADRAALVAEAEVRARAAAAAQTEVHTMRTVLADAARLRTRWADARAALAVHEDAARALEGERAGMKAAIAAEKRRLNLLREAAEEGEARARRSQAQALRARERALAADLAATRAAVAAAKQAHAAAGGAIICGVEPSAADVSMLFAPGGDAAAAGGALDVSVTGRSSVGGVCGGGGGGGDGDCGWTPGPSDVDALFESSDYSKPAAGGAEDSLTLDTSANLSVNLSIDPVAVRAEAADLAAAVARARAALGRVRAQAGVEAPRAEWLRGALGRAAALTSSTAAASGAPAAGVAGLALERLAAAEVLAVIGRARMAGARRDLVVLEAAAALTAGTGAGAGGDVCRTAAEAALAKLIRDGVCTAKGDAANACVFYA